MARMIKNVQSSLTKLSRDLLHAKVNLRLKSMFILSIDLELLTSLSSRNYR